MGKFCASNAPRTQGLRLSSTRWHRLLWKFLLAQPLSKITIFFRHFKRGHYITIQHQPKQMHHFCGEKSRRKSMEVIFLKTPVSFLGAKVCFKEGFCRSYPIISRDHDWSLKAPKTQKKKKQQTDTGGLPGIAFLASKTSGFLSTYSRDGLLCLKTDASPLW